MSLKYTRRKFMNFFMMGLIGFMAALAVIPLINVFLYVLKQGLPALDWDFFTELPKPVGEVGGGMGNAMLGSLTLVGLASFIGVPWGLAAGIYLSEYGRGKIASNLRFTIDLLTSVPSIVVGLFTYALIVKPMQGFSAYAGGIALAIIMIPIVAKSTEEILKLVPSHIREAGLALGIPRWKVILKIVLPGSIGPVFTGIMLAVARVAGETAPILFTAFSNRGWSHGLNQPTASLPVMIYTYAISPFEDWHRQAWAAALVLVVFVLLINVVTRWLLRQRS